MTINAEWVSILKTSHPAAFTAALPAVPVSWFVDGQIKLMKGAWITTWEVFFRMQFVRTIDRAFDSGAQVVIMGFDDYTHVPECKGMTQRKRNKAAQDFVYDSANGLPETPPQDWNAAMRNRTFKIAVINFIVKNIKLHYKHFDKTVIVDWVGAPVVLGRELGADARALPDCVLDAASKRGECDIKAFAWTTWGPTMIESTDGDFIPLALLQTSIDSTKRIFLERIHTRTSNKRSADDSRKRQMEFVDIASLHAHVHTLLPRQEQPIQTLAMLIALTGCDFCNSLPAIGPTKLWAARHLFRNVDVSAEGGALAAISHTYTQNFAMHIVAGKESDITDSAASPEHAARVYETTASHIQRSAKLSAQTRDRIWTATHMRNHVRNAMWTVLQYWSRLEQYADPTLAEHGYHKDSRGVCHFKMD
jgi:hypothetical protein